MWMHMYDIEGGWKLFERETEIKEIMRCNEARARMGMGKKGTARTFYKRLYARVVSVFAQHRVHVAREVRA